MSEPPLVFEKRNQNCSCILTALLLTATQEQDGRNDLRLINLGVCAVLFQNSLQKWATQLGYTTQTLLFIEFTPCWIGRKRSYNLYFRCLNAKPEIIKSIEFYKYVYVPWFINSTNCNTRIHWYTYIGHILTQALPRFNSFQLPNLIYYNNNTK